MILNILLKLHYKSKNMNVLEWPIQIRMEFVAIAVHQWPPFNESLAEQF